MSLATQVLPSQPTIRRSSATRGVPERRSTLRSVPVAPISPPATPLFLVGRNSQGLWTVRDRHGLYGGFFVNRAEAVRYARFESGHSPGAVAMAPDGLELEISPRADGCSNADPPRGTVQRPAMSNWFKHHGPMVLSWTVLTALAAVLLWLLQDVESGLVLKGLLISSTIVSGTLLLIATAQFVSKTMVEFFRKRAHRHIGPREPIFSTDRDSRHQEQ